MISWSIHGPWPHRLSYRKFIFATFLTHGKSSDFGKVPVNAIQITTKDLEIYENSMRFEKKSWAINPIFSCNDGLLLVQRISNFSLKIYTQFKILKFVNLSKMLTLLLSTRWTFSMASKNKWIRLITIRCYERSCTEGVLFNSDLNNSFIS